MFPVLRLRRCRLEPKDVAACVRLGHGQTDELLPAENLAGNALAQFGVAEVEDGRETDDGAGVETVSIPASTNAGNFLLYDKLVEVVELLPEVSLSLPEARAEVPRVPPVRRLRGRAHGRHRRAEARSL